MEQSVLQRFKKSVEYLKEAKIAKSQKEIGNAMGVSPSYFSEILHDRIKLTAEHIQIFCTEYRVNPLYLFGTSENILASTPYHESQKRIDLATDYEASPSAKSIFVTPKTGKNVTPTVTPTQENCRICEEKDKRIAEQQARIEDLKEYIDLLKDQIPDQKKAVG